MVKRTGRFLDPRTACSTQVVLGAVAAVLLGCASPGQPKPPSLHLPQTVAQVSAQRVGGVVHLRWTTPSQTTDKLPVPAEMSAVICRREPVSGGTRRPCVEVANLPVHPGESEADDMLPAALVTDPAGVLAYRVEIRNAAGRSAGFSPEAFAAGGSAPPAVTDLTATPVREGVRLEWRAEPGGGRIELHRVDIGQISVPRAGRSRRPVLAGAVKEGAEVDLGANGAEEPDPGGAIDETAQKGSTYRYTAQRVQNTVAGGHTLEVRGAVSPAVTVKVLATFPPKAPAGLDAAAAGAGALSIDLSWRPGAEADLAGYNVYRAEVPDGGSPGLWRRLNSGLVAIPGFQDSAVRSGVCYAYRVTAVDNDGNESAPGNEVQETPGTR